MLRRWDRIQHAIIESFTSRGTRPTPIWSLNEFEPNDEQRAYLQRKIARLGASDQDFLRWRNACVAYSLPESLDALATLDNSDTAPTATPLWVTSHLLRRKVYTAAQASIAAHLALVAVPGSGRLVPAHEQPLLLALDAVTRYNLVHMLPALTSRILALPTKHHTKLLAILCKHNLPPSPLAAASLQLVLDDIATNLIMLPNETWQSVWEKWVIIHPLGDNFTTSLRLQIRDQGFQAPHYRNFHRSKAYTQYATNFPKRINPSRQDPTLAALTAAAYSRQVSARFLLGIASTLGDGLFPPHPDQRRTNTSVPSVTFLTALILGLVRKGAYSRAVGVWQNAKKSVHRIAVTPKLVEATVSAYILNGDLEEAVEMLDKYARSMPKPESPTNDQKGRARLPQLVTLLISRLPASGQNIAFAQSYERWAIQPDSSALEAVMIGAAQATAKQSRGDLDLRSNVRELQKGFKNIFGRTSARVEPFEQTIFSPGPFHKQDAIGLFQNVLFRNWPFIRGVEQGYWEGLLEKQAIDLFIPISLTVRRRALDDTTANESPDPRPAIEFTPSPLHPSPTPLYPHACPTRRTWTVYLSLLDPEELPQALGWMKSVDEFLHAHSTSTGSPLDLFRPERAAMIDVLMRWEDAVLAGETPVGRAWEERKKRAEGGVGREGALRTWLIEWLGDEYVPSRSEIATARIKVND
ncbi:unnamed protein product [Rhizoctonia solani]|uniref:Uncharacterized protein n=1 Tax=Rhizoctonia solani TaxID=456999 RepID=A0A8H2WXE0_9AGAM|nr:unnamed protein product [Rhizoctonia solani]